MLARRQKRHKMRAPYSRRSVLWSCEPPFCAKPGGAFFLLNTLDWDWDWGDQHGVYFHPTSGCEKKSRGRRRRRRLSMRTGRFCLLTLFCLVRFVLVGSWLCSGFSGAFCPRSWLVLLAPKVAQFVLVLQFNDGFVDAVHYGIFSSGGHAVHFVQRFGDPLREIRSEVCVFSEALPALVLSSCTQACNGVFLQRGGEMCRASPGQCVESARRIFRVRNKLLSRFAPRIGCFFGRHLGSGWSQTGEWVNIALSKKFSLSLSPNSELDRRIKPGALAEEEKNHKPKPEKKRARAHPRHQEQSNTNTDFLKFTWPKKVKTTRRTALVSKTPKLRATEASRSERNAKVVPIEAHHVQIVSIRCFQCGGVAGRLDGKRWVRNT